MSSEFQQRLLSLKKRYQGNLTPRYNKILNKDIKKLERPEIRRMVLKVGDQMPDFELENQHGEIVSSAKLLKVKPLIITFYRGFWCPYCNIDMNNLQKYVPEIEAMGAQMIAMSPERHDYSKRIIKRQGLTFDILQDRRNEVAAKFGIKWKLSEEVKKLYKENFHYNLMLYHGDDDWSLPVPARFLADTSGTIRYAESTPDYSTRPDPDDLMNVLKNL
jgi:peroxiredoxin